VLPARQLQGESSGVGETDVGGRGFRYAYYFVGRILSELDVADSSAKLDGLIKLLRHDVVGSSAMRQSLAMGCLTQAAAAGMIPSPASISSLSFSWCPVEPTSTGTLNRTAILPPPARPHVRYRGRRVCTHAPGNAATQRTLREMLNEMLVRIAECKERPRRRSRMTSFLASSGSGPEMPGALMQSAVFQAMCCGERRRRVSPPHHGSAGRRLDP
jgi:hypothetical protein